MSKFHPGDICIGQNFVSDSELNGVECEVKERSECGGVFFHFRTNQPDRIEGLCYLVEWVGGERTWVREFNLRKRPPEQGWDSFFKATGIKDKVTA